MYSSFFEIGLLGGGGANHLWTIDEIDGLKENIKNTE